MTETEKLAICLRLREAQESLGKLFEDVALDSKPLVCLGEVSKLADLACELQSAFVRLSRRPGEMQLAGGAVALGDLVVVDDAGAQKAMAAEQNARADGLERRRAG